MLDKVINETTVSVFKVVLGSQFTFFFFKYVSNSRFKNFICHMLTLDVQ